MLDCTKQGDVAVLTMDDGKANAVGYDLIGALNEALDKAEADAKAIVLVGRPGKFSAGFDLSVMQSGGVEEAMKLVGQGGKLLLRLFSYPLPVVAACTGHAIAAGAFMLLSSDTRFGIDGEFKIGLNETAIGMVLPVFGFQLAKARLSKRHLTASAIQAKLYDPRGAVDAGYLDRIVPTEQLVETAVETATALAAMPGDAYHGNKLGMRQEFIDVIAKSLD